MQAAMNDLYSTKSSKVGSFDFAIDAAQMSNTTMHGLDRLPHELVNVDGNSLLSFHGGCANTVDLNTMNNQVLKGIGCVVAAAAVLAPITGSTLPGMWLRIYEAPATTVAWDGLHQQNHPSINSTEVKSLLAALPGASVSAIRELYDVFVEAFNDAVELEATYRFHIDHETGAPKLFLTLDTHGMDLSEVMRREMALFDQIDQQPALKAATEYHIVSAI